MAEVFVDYYVNGNREQLRPNLLYTDAEKIAGHVKGRKMRYTQPRKFYNQAIMHRQKLEEKTKNNENEDMIFKKELPYIKMMVAKVKYAQGKKGSHISKEFVEFIDTYIGRIETKKDFMLFCDLFEAVMAYLRTMIKKD